MLAQFVAVGGLAVGTVKPHCSAVRYAQIELGLGDLRIPPPHTLSGAQFAQIIGAKRARKCARSLFNCISVTDCIKINEQNK